MLTNSSTVFHGTSFNNGDLYPDSDDSHYVTPHMQNIQQNTPFEGPDQIFIGNGRGLTINS